MSIETVRNLKLLYSAARRSGLTVMVLLLFNRAALCIEYTARYEPSPGESKVRIDGTSNIHDWSIKGTVIDGYIDVNETCQFNLSMKKLPDLKEVKSSLETHTEIPIKSLKSGHSGMDKNTYKALKREQYPNIIYDMENVSIKTPPKPPNLTAEFNTVGKLSIAGVTRTLTMPVTVKALEQQQFEIAGTTSVKMTDFGITPPTALFGLLRSGDQITIHFSWTIDRKTPMPHLPKYSAAPEYRQVITELIIYYLQAENALAGNQMSQANEALGKVQKAAEKLSQTQTEKLEEQEKKTWDEDIKHLRDAARDAVNVKGSDSIRMAFRKLSQHTITLVSDFGYAPLDSDKPLFSFRCSKNNEQAKEKVWLQNTATADSPYEPTARGHLSCGEQTGIYCPQRPDGQEIKKDVKQKTQTITSP
jgi:hypothetical protein